ncbi:SUMF1/EgtB/PvdO family nonheme iron enzyme [Terasakiella sp. A23]|uniref:formylglycine-generating enzyme family protein n=1 Tax=Terasakiella sp. FCG-A23 TaxID=3080561 RepID=UPI00295381A7|nr:SUMF1/EgtB/PvdO family nonheme iron enzyme [Terasakiella sp. A23]MDV7341315.1 SUMF1/EgtB/PvdO family nonheme iron enzyme [Terasakiella sp. A23]
MAFHRFKGISIGLCLLLLSACANQPTPQEAAQLKEMPDLVPIPASIFFMGSGDPERETAYRADEAAYHTAVTRNQGWYEYELPSFKTRLPRFFITKYPITNYQYAAFIRETRREAPDVDVVDWNSYGLNHPFESTRKYAWDEDGFPQGREDHPVVLVDYNDARAYAEWLSLKTGRYWRLPTESEWELAARGLDGRAYPWGQNFNPAKANTADLGPHDTMPVGSFPRGASPFGVMDMAGQVYEWTSTPGERGRMTVKGGAWDDRGCGVCRAAARHHRRADMKHTLIGFRLVQEFAK